LQAGLEVPAGQPSVPQQGEEAEECKCWRRRSSGEGACRVGIQFVHGLLAGGRFWPKEFGNVVLIICIIPDPLVVRSEIRSPLKSHWTPPLSATLQLKRSWKPR